MHRWPIFGVVGTLTIALVAGCGPGVPELATIPAAMPIADGGDRARGARIFGDRAFGRTGFACADCHPGPGTTGPRPGPALDRWASGQARWSGVETTPIAALSACIERFQARPEPSPPEAAGLRAALLSAPSRPTDKTYEATCADCHERGPAPALRGRPWSARTLTAWVRGTNRPPHPITLMPRFDSARLSDAELAAIHDALRAP